MKSNVWLSTSKSLVVQSTVQSQLHVQWFIDWPFMGSVTWPHHTMCVSSENTPGQEGLRRRWWGSWQLTMGQLKRLLYATTTILEAAGRLPQDGFHVDSMMFWQWRRPTCTIWQGLSFWGKKIIFWDFLCISNTWCNIIGRIYLHISMCLHIKWCLKLHCYILCHSKYNYDSLDTFISMLKCQGVRKAVVLVKKYDK